MIVLGLGECGASSDPADVLKIIGLGSCVATIALDPVNRIVGMVHVALPSSSMRQPDVDGHPGRYADTAIPHLLRCMAGQGSSPPAMWSFKLVGGAAVLDPNGTFDIGRRNVIAVRRVLWTTKLRVDAEEVGGSLTRTVQATVAGGRVIVSSPGLGQWEI